MNKNIIKTILVSVCSMAAGYLLGYEVSKKKYLEKADHEIASVKQAYQKELNILYVGKKKDQTTVPAKKQGNNQNEHEGNAKKNKQESNVSKDDNGKEIGDIQKSYIDYSKRYMGDEKTPSQDSYGAVSKKGARTPYVISPDDYNNSDYEQHILIFYEKDKVLADEDYNPILNPDIIIGPDALKSFGQNQEDCVFVRDDDRKVDYEIELDHRSYKSSAPYGSDAAAKVECESDAEDDDDDKDKDE